MNNNDQGKICLQQQTSQAAALKRVSGKRATSDEPPVNNNRHQANEEDRGSQQATTEARKKPTVSSRKAEANRRNSLKSTGPRTPNGKKTVARNALKHGFFSKSLLIQHPDGKENQAEYEEFYAALREDSRPIGFREELCVERLAISSWRQRRLLRFERGQVTRSLAEHSHDLEQSKKESSEHPELAPLSNPELDLLTDHFLLPSKEEVDKLLRYEAMINKQLNQALAELERLQRRRNGESVPAPISVEISRHD